MAKKISNKDIFEGNIFKPTTENAEQLNDELKKLITGFSTLAKTIKSELPKGEIKTFEQLTDATKNVNDLDVAFKGFTKTEQERLKVEKQLLQVEQQKAKVEQQNIKNVAEEEKVKQQTIKTNIILTKEKERQAKIAAKEEKQLADNNDAYKRASKRLNELRSDYKKLRVEEGKSTKETEELRKEIQKLDKELKDVDAEVGQFQRSVGDYNKEALGATQNTLAWAAALVGLNGGLGDVEKSLSANEAGSKELNGLLAQAEAVTGVFFNRLGTAASGLLEFGKGVVNGERSLIGLVGELNKVGTAFDGTVEASLKAAEAAKEASDATFDLDRSSLALREELTRLNGEFDKLNAIAGDSTKTFDEQQAAAERAEAINIRRLDIQRQIAAEELAIIQTRLEGTEDDQNRFALELEASEKRIELQELQNELNVAAIENQKVLGEIQRDRFERELDFAIDAFDTQKTINERLIADDRKSIEERAKIFDETVRLANSSFESQKQLFATFVDDRINFDELVAETDEKAIRRTLRRLDLDDIELGRALEVIKERKIALQDLDDADRDLTDARLERAQSIADAEQSAEQDTFALKSELLQRELENEELTAEARKRIISEIFDNEKKIIEDQAQFDEQVARTTIKDADELAARLAEIETIKNNDIIRLEEETQKQITDIQKDAQDERLENGIETANKLVGLTSEAVDKAANEQEKALEESIARREEVVNQQQRRAEQGLENQLAFEKQKLAQQERERKELAEKRAKAEEAQALAQAFLNAFQARVKDDPDTAGAKALTDVIVAKALSETIAGAFAEGVEDFQGEGTGTSDSNIIRFSHGESVVTAKATKENKGLVTAMNNGDVGSWFASNMMLTPLSGEKNYDSFGLLANKIDSIEKAIRSRPTTQTNLDNMGNVLQSTYKNGVKNTVKYLNQRPRI